MKLVKTIAFTNGSDIVSVVVTFESWRDRPATNKIMNALVDGAMKVLNETEHVRAPLSKIRAR